MSDTPLFDTSASLRVLAAELHEAQSAFQEARVLYLQTELRVTQVATVLSAKAAEDEAWRDWAKKMAKSKKDSVLSKSKASELKTQIAEQKLMYEAMEAEKWTEGWDEFTERVFFEHIETGEIAWDVKPKRRFVSSK